MQVHIVSISVRLVRLSPQALLRFAPDTLYSKQRGYGFETAPVGAGVIDKNTTTVDARFKHTWRVETGMAWLNEMTRDYVSGPAFRFRVDVPNGRYDVVATLGYKHPLRGLRYRPTAAKWCATWPYSRTTTRCAPFSTTPRGRELRGALHGRCHARGSVVLDFSGQGLASLMGRPSRRIATCSTFGVEAGKARRRTGTGGVITDPVHRAWAYMTFAGHPRSTGMPRADGSSRRMPCFTTPRVGIRPMSRWPIYGPDGTVH